MRIFLLTITLFSSLIAVAQDPQYSQYYANLLYLNPAFAGSEEMSRAFTIGRYQWPGLDAKFYTLTASLDGYFDKYNSGVGVIMTSDYAPFSSLRTNELGLQYAYRLAVSESITFRAGMQISYANRSVDFNKMDFSSQYNNQGFQGGASGETFIDNQVSYMNIAAGGVLYAHNFWIGWASHNLTTPNQSLINGLSYLPTRHSLHVGYKYYLKPQEKKRYGVKSNNDELSISPVANYRFQGASDQFDIGAYLNYNQYVVGMWYKGIPLKKYQSDTHNNESMVILAGLSFDNFRIGYSYDATVSRLTKARTYGAHELSITYLFQREEIGKKKTKPKQRKPVCPKF